MNRFFLTFSLSILVIAAAPAMAFADEGHDHEAEATSVSSSEANGGPLAIDPPTTMGTPNASTGRVESVAPEPPRAANTQRVVTGGGASEAPRHVSHTLPLHRAAVGGGQAPLPYTGLPELTWLMVIGSVLLLLGITAYRSAGNRLRQLVFESNRFQWRAAPPAPRIPLPMLAVHFNDKQRFEWKT